MQPARGMGRAALHPASIGGVLANGLTPLPRPRALFGFPSFLSFGAELCYPNCSLAARSQVCMQRSTIAGWPWQAAAACIFYAWTGLPETPTSKWREVNHIDFPRMAYKQAWHAVCWWCQQQGCRQEPALATTKHTKPYYLQDHSVDTELTIHGEFGSIWCSSEGTL